MLRHFIRQTLLVGIVSLNVLTIGGSNLSASEEMLKMALPENAVITLVNGQKYSGVKVTAINGQSVTFQKGGVTKTLPKNQVKGIAFSGQYVMLGSERTVRGTNLAGCTAVDPISVSDTLLSAAEADIAALDTSELARMQQMELNQVAEGRGYVIESITFEGEEMVINTKACSP